MTFEIERGIPLPKKRNDRSPLKEAMIALSQADISDGVSRSIFVPKAKLKSLQICRLRWGIPAKVLVMRNVEGGVRIWKGSEPSA